MATIAANEGPVKYATREKNPNNEDNMVYYSETFDTEYTATADGVTNITLSIPIGSEVIQVEKNIQPMKRADWAWNTGTLLLVLQNGISMGSGETLYIIYKRIITS